MLISDAIALTAGFFGGYASRYGAALSFGFALPLIEAGWQNVYRGQDGDIDYNWPIAMLAPAADIEIEQALAPGVVMHYTVTTLSDCCKESDAAVAAIVRIGDDGEMLPYVPSEPFDVAAEPVAGAKLRVQWKYSAENEEIAVAGFSIYVAAVGEAFDFDTPAGQVSASARIWTSAAKTHGVAYKVCVRAASAAGDETINTDYATATADSAGPTGLPAITAGYVEVE